MNILYYCAHPAQYHFFKNTVRNLLLDGHRILMLIKTKDILEDLLKEDGIEYINIQVQPRKNSKIAILFASFQRTAKVLQLARRFRADILIGTDSSIAQAGWLLRKPAITTLEDDYEIIKNLARLTFPFSSDVIVPTECSVGKYKNKKIAYEGFMKLAYLHPNEFTPDATVLHKYGISGKYILIRLAKLSAHHDQGINGLSTNLVKNIISKAQEYGYSTYITSENVADEALTPYLLHIKYSDVHHILAYAGMMISDSQSMSVEAAMLGVPSIRFSDFAGRISVLESLEHKYKMTFGVRTSEPERMMAIFNELITTEDIQKEFEERRKEMLTDKIDVTAFFTWFIENYPESRKIMKENPEYQYRFK